MKSNDDDEDRLDGQDDDFGLALEPEDKCVDSFVGRTVRGVQIEQLLDQGGMGSVYRGLQIDLGVPVAVKVIRPEVLSDTALNRFQSEMRLLARLEHVGIPRIKFADVWDGRPYFVMDFIPAARDIVTFAKEQRLTLRQKLELFQRACDAVGFGHLAGVIHRDLKPKNILVDGTGQPKVIDFGIAQLQEQAESIDDGGAGMRQPGSPAYMSPEQWGCHNAGEPDVRTDVYSLGVVLYELLADREPYCIKGDTNGADRRAAVRAAACDQQPIPLPAIPKDVWAITACCLAKDPEERYSNARELGQDVARFLRGDPVRANPPGPWRIIAHLVNRHRAAVFAMLAAVGLLGAALGWAAYERGRIDEARMEELNRLLVSFDSIDRILADMRDRVDVFVPDDHARAVRMLRMIADHQGRLGSWSRATDALRLAVVRMGNLSPAEIGSEAMYQVRSELVRAQLQADQPGNALADATALVEWLERQQEPDQGRRLDALGMQAVACRHAAQLTEAIEIGEQIVPQLAELRGGDHVETLQAMNNLAVAERRAGRTESAHERLLEIHDRAVSALGEKHPDTLTFAHNLAVAKLSLGREDDAETIFESVWDARRMKYGDRHPATIATLTELCRLRRKRSDALGVVRRLQSLEPSLREVVSSFDGQVATSCIRLLHIGRWAFDHARDEPRVEEIDVMLMSAGQEPTSHPRLP